LIGLENSTALFFSKNFSQQASLFLEQAFSFRIMIDKNNHINSNSSKINEHDSIGRQHPLRLPLQGKSNSPPRCTVAYRASSSSLTETTRNVRPVYPVGT
jgi:hypothetical protein